MDIFCATCLATHEVVQAATVSRGEALCARHFAASIENPAMTREDLHEMVTRCLDGAQRFDPLGRPLD